MSGAAEEGSQDDLAAAWGASLAEAVEGIEEMPAPAPDAAKVLNQAEIDSLLGFDGKTEERHRSGIERVVDAGLVSYDRLPMLEIVFDRLVRLLTTTLRNFTSDNVEVSLDNMTSMRFGDYLDSIPLPAMLAVVKVKQWDNHALIVVDSAMIYSIVDVLLGGRRGTSAMRIEGRPYTTIERTLVERLISVVLSDLGHAFSPIAGVEFCFERLEVNPRFAAISRLSNAAVLARMRIEMEDRGGRLDMILPYATLEPVREVLLQQFMGERFGRDSIWENHLAEELRHTLVRLDVVLDEQTLPLSTITALKPGDRIALNVAPGAPVRLRCGDVPLFEGQLGRRENRLAVRVERELRRDGAGVVRMG